MIEYRVYYIDGNERYVVHGDNPGMFDRKLPPGANEDYPDEVKLFGEPLIKREKNLNEFTKEDWKKYNLYFRLASKDIPLSRAIPKEWK